VLHGEREGGPGGEGEGDAEFEFCAALGWARACTVSGRSDRGGEGVPGVDVGVCVEDISGRLFDLDSMRVVVVEFMACEARCSFILFGGRL
jgi:hypothetical protein